MDLSLLEFKKGRIRLSLYVEPICLWHPETEITQREIGRLASWTEDSINNNGIIPSTITATINKEERCLRSNLVHANQSSHQTFCGSAGGDSGGGFYIEVSRSNFLLAGIESLPLPCVHCNLSDNAIYTNVPKFIDWIEQVAGRQPDIQR